MKKNLLSLLSLILCYDARSGALRFYSSAWKLSFVFSLLFSVTTSAQIRMVADLNQTAPEYSRREFGDHISTGTRSFFVIGQGFGQELWTSDGTQAGTMFLKHFTQIGEMKDAGGKAFFSAGSDEYGTELWISDGTVAGTLMLTDIYPGGGSSSPLAMTSVNGTLYFSANDKTHGRELWKSNGTVGGTQLVYDVRPGAESSGVSKVTAFGSSLLFVANDGTTGYELWKSDGSNAGTSIVSDINPAGNSSPDGITIANGMAFFAAEAPLTNRQLYKSDGTAAGTGLVKVIRTGNRNAKIAEITAVNNSVFFEAEDDTHGLELWKSDGSAGGTVLVKDITAPSGGETDADFLAGINGKLFFTANKNYYRELWVSDGTSAGTLSVTTSNIWFRNNPGFVEVNGDAMFVAAESMSADVTLFRSNGTTPSIVKSKIADCACDFSSSEIPPIAFPDFEILNNEYYFFAGNEYWKTDGTASGTVLVKDLSYQNGILPTRLVDLNGTLLFGMENTDTEPAALWRTTGTPETTMKVQDIFLSESLVTYNGLAWFEGESSVGASPYRTDGTPEGTVKLSPTLRWPGNFVGAGGNMFFSAEGPLGTELYKSDGTPEGTVAVKDIDPSGSSAPRNMVNVNEVLFFSAETPEHGNALWKSDGTTSGTVMIKDLAPGSSYTRIDRSISYQNQVFFQADDGSHGMELWKSNGTAAGTVMVSDIRTNDGDSDDMGFMTTANGFLFFFGLDQDGKASLFKSTSSSVTKLRAFGLDFIYDMYFLASTSNRILFLVRTGADTELWKSDGSVTGTTRIHKFRDVTFLARDRGAVRDNIVYFGLGGKVWRSDATAAGIWEIPFTGHASKFTTSGPYVYFFGESAESGGEIFLIEEETGSRSSARIATAEEQLNAEGNITGFPNPFRSTITLRVDGDENETFSVNVLSATGQEIFGEVTLKNNVNHELGSSWNDGLYFIRIRQGKTITTKKVIKTMN